MNKQAMYRLLCRQMTSLSESCSAPLPCLANAAALLWDTLPDLNWAGFYLLKGDCLYLGPFQGKTACTVIPVGRGVCGTAVKENAVQLVPDVHRFPGHIACDSASNAEIVLPLCKDGRILGVLDIDSPQLNRFDEEDRDGLSSFVSVLMQASDWSGGLL